MEKITQIKAPFTEEQVKKINEYQNRGNMHPFTCCSPDDIDECQRKRKTYPDGRVAGGLNEGILIATTEGLVCPCGKYKQNWVHSFMAE